MKPELRRVSLALEPDAQEAALLAALEQALGHAPELVWRLRGARVLSCRMTAEEMEIARRVPGIRSVREEQRAELIPRPFPPRKTE